MEADLLEIIELPSGDIALKRVDDEGDPLVTISFSPESEVMLDRLKMSVARAMLEAGMNVYAELNAVDSDEPSIIH